MRILQLDLDRGVPVLGHKGGSVHVRAMATAFAALGHDVTLACSRLGEGNEAPPARLIELAPPPGTGSAPLPVTREVLERRERALLAHDAALPERILAALRAAGVRPDLIYERHALFHLAGVELAQRLGIPRVLEVNAPLAEEQARFRGLALAETAAAHEGQSWRQADLVVAVSEALRQRLLAEGVAPERAMVEPNGVDTARFRPDAAAGAALRAQLGLGQAPVMGFVGSFKVWHGGAALLEVLQRLRPAWPDLRLLAVGEGPELAALRAQAAAMGLGSVALFTGAVPHDAVPAHLAAMDFVVAPYRPATDFYFSPLKIVEALAAGKPVVAPRLGQIEALLREGENGLLYPPDDGAALAAACAKLLEAPALRRRLGAAAAAGATAAWDWQALAGRVLARACEPARASA